MPTETRTAEPTQQPGEVTAANDDLFEGGDSVETQETSVGEEPGTSAEVEGSETQTVEAEGEGVEQSEADADWLPDEQSKVFRDEDYARYAKRYGFTEEQATDPQIRRLLHDKINSDILLKQQQQAEGEQEAEPEAQPEPTQQAPAQQSPEEFEKSLVQYVDHITDLPTAEKFGAELDKANSIRNTKERHIALTKVMSRGMVNLLRTALPDLLGVAGPDGQSLFSRLANSNFEGFGDFWGDTSKSRAWDKAVAASPNAKNLPRYGTPEWEASIKQVSEIVPGFENAKFTDPKTGKDLSPYQNFVKKSEVAVKILTRQKVEPAEVKAAVDKGKELQKKQTQAVQNSRVLGAGQSKGQIAQKVTGNDDIFGRPGEVTLTNRL